MGCSFCKKNGHTKVTCPEKKAEKIKFQRDRINMFIQVLPILASNPIFQALLWWQISKRNSTLDFTNKLIVSNEILGLTELGGASFSADVQPVSLPEGVVLGAIIQEVEDAVELGSWATEKGKAIIEKTKQKYSDTKTGISDSGYAAGSSDIVRDVEEGLRYYFKYQEIPQQLKDKYGFWN